MKIKITIALLTTSINLIQIGQAETRKNGEGILYRLLEYERNPDKELIQEGIIKEWRTLG